MERELIAILEPYDDAYAESSSPRNNDAKTTLKIFYTCLTKCKMDKEYKVSEQRFMHTSYLSKLFAVRTALKENNYLHACNEIISLIHYEPFMQSRIYFNLINLLEQYLEVS